MVHKIVLGVHADALRRCYEELMLPRNDPEYLRTLEDHEKDRTSVANVSASMPTDSQERPPCSAFKRDLAWFEAEC